MIRADAAEAVEEGFSYPLLKEQGEKEEFFDKMEDFDRSSADFRAKARLDEAGEETENELFNAIVTAKNQALSVGAAMFSDYERAWQSVDAAEEAVARFTGLLDQLQALVSENVARAQATRDTQALGAELNALQLLQAMRAEALEGVEEAFAFIVLQAQNEKQEFFAQMDEFDAAAAVYRVAQRIGEAGGEREFTLFAQLTAAKSAVANASTTMFTDFERAWQSAKTFEVAEVDLTRVLCQMENIEAAELLEAEAVHQGGSGKRVGILVSLIVSVVLILGIGVFVARSQSSAE